MPKRNGTCPLNTLRFPILRQRTIDTYSFNKIPNIYQKKQSFTLNFNIKLYFWHSGIAKVRIQESTFFYFLNFGILTRRNLCNKLPNWKGAHDNLHRCSSFWLIIWRIFLLLLHIVQRNIFHHAMYVRTIKVRFQFTLCSIKTRRGTTWLTWQRQVITKILWEYFNRSLFARLDYLK